eukprot:TRINITY_DN7411_c0_g1_i2.p1 TRINITY_DN7411_c0_g1~~TRINITY_DN7411_c0_g1_i2.p1  ORF type:complete len:114 (-),score=38.26 TRINITY_DN7411_c0_g1_i2:91-432(-)
MCIRDRVSTQSTWAKKETENEIKGKLDYGKSINFIMNKKYFLIVMKVCLEHSLDIQWHSRRVTKKNRNVYVQSIEDYILSLIHISEPTRPLYISYAVFCLKKKKKKKQLHQLQ